MIEVNNLSKKYDNITVLDIPKLSIAEGESFGLVGNNGAGKTTFFRLILDLIEASTGEVSINGQRVARNDNWKPWVGSFLDEGFLIDFFTPDDFSPLRVRCMASRQVTLIRSWHRWKNFSMVK